MKNGYNNIFWGLILATFHLNIGVIKIIPAFIAFLIIAYGIEELKSKNNNRNLEKAFIYCNYLALINFIAAISVFTGLDIWGLEVELISSNIGIVLEILTMYHILVGSREIFELKNIDTINIRENSIIRYITIYSVLAIVINISRILFIESIISIVSISMLLVRICLLFKFSKLRKDFGNQ